LFTNLTGEQITGDEVATISGTVSVATTHVCKNVYSLHQQVSLLHEPSLVFTNRYQKITNVFKRQQPSSHD
jgi:hypothetical protein